MGKKETTNELISSMFKSKDTTSARKLLERSPEASYTEQWTHLLIKEKNPVREVTESSVVIFELGAEWLAIPTVVFTEVSHLRFIHSIPHRTNDILAGIVNLRGQMVLCVNLHKLLDIELTPLKTVQSEKNRRFLTISRNEDRWIFPVDELFGIHHCQRELLENVPVTIAKSTANYLKGVFTWNGRSVGLLDEELLFFSLRRSAL